MGPLGGLPEVPNALRKRGRHKAASSRLNLWSTLDVKRSAIMSAAFSQLKIEISNSAGKHSSVVGVAACSIFNKATHFPDPFPPENFHNYFSIGGVTFFL